MEEILSFLGEFWEGILALIALAFSILSFWQQRRHNRISVQPQFELRVVVHDGDFIIQVSNVGLGSMFIESFVVEHKITRDTLTMEQLNNEYLIDYSIGDRHLLSLFREGWLKSGDSMDMIRFEFENERGNELYDIVRDLIFVCKYQDVYKRSFKSSRRF